MALYELDQWEHNSVNDSDWYSVVYDTETNELRRVETGTTRFAGDCYIGPAIKKEVPPEIRERATVALAALYFDYLKRNNAAHVATPEIDVLTVGTRVRVIAKTRSAVKAFDLEPCIKCSGSGKWINPRNAQDARECFACKGTGNHKANFRKVQGEYGKQVWNHIEAGTVGTVVGEVRSYGKFYRNGYNRPDRSNSTVAVKLDDGRELAIGCSKLRLDCEPLTDAELRVNARKWADQGDFYSFFRTAGFRL